MATVVELGHRDHFALGVLHVRPSACDAIGPDGREALEPRVMKVLVALAEAKGATVTRDDLVRLCWNGRIVGDDAINRVILKLRQLARGAGGNSFAIETIKKVGYRLVVDPTTQREAAILDFPHREAAADVAPRAKRSGKWLWSALVGVILAVIASLWLAGTRRESADASNPVARDLATRGQAAVLEGTPAQLQQGIAYLRQALEALPNNADLWGSLAMGMTLNQAMLAPNEQRLGAARIREAADRSLSLDRGEGHGWGALVNLVPSYRNWTAKRDAIRNGLAQADRGAPALLRQRILFEQATGATAQALAHSQHLMKVHPLVPFIRADYLGLLRANGRQEEAEAAGAEAAKLWPGDMRIWHERFLLAALGGEAEQALAMADNRAQWPRAVRAEDMQRYRLFALALRTGARTDADRVITAYWAAAGDGQFVLENAIVAAAALGRADDAFAFADRLYADSATPIRQRFVDHTVYVVANDRATAFWFLPPLDRLWCDQRFMALMGRIGLVGYWRGSGDAPDLCLSNAIRDRCRAAGLRL